MNKSTGGLVRLERTSVKEGSLFLRLLSQSSCCLFWSSSMAVGSKCRRRGQRRASVLVSHPWQPHTLLCNTLKPLFIISAMSSFAKALSPALREIRILCCQSAQASAGTRCVDKGSLCMTANAITANSLCPSTPSSRNTTRTCPY